MRETSPPSPWVIRFLAAVRPGGRILDVACGSGRHTLAAASLGFAVTGIDRDISMARQQAEACGGLPAVDLVEADLESGAPWPFAPASFDAVVVANYLWRPILPDIVATLATSGVLIYETFAIGNERFGRPSNPDFLLRPGELLEAVAGRLVPIAYEHLRLQGPDRIVQRLCALGPDHEGLRTPPRL
ncbi:MAG: class I SAM-dependent methyltransferase [Alphaproteobacteria bacterium]|nr:class I SAM-dependent methyltransferase [Alphaproteobacteria bacterium]